MSRNSWRQTFSEMTSEELEAGNLQVSLRWASGAVTFPCRCRAEYKMVTHHPPPVERTVTQCVPSGVWLPLRQESRSGTKIWPGGLCAHALTQLQKGKNSSAFLKLYYFHYRALEDNNNGEKEFGNWGLCWISHAVSKHFIPVILRKQSLPQRKNIDHPHWAIKQSGSQRFKLRYTCFTLG